MTVRQIERYYRDLGLSRRKAKIAASRAVSDGLVKRIKPGPIQRLTNALRGILSQ